MIEIEINLEVNAKAVVVQLDCAPNLQVEKDSSLPLGMTANP
jgi:hypothetical protein